MILCACVMMSPAIIIDVHMKCGTNHTSGMRVYSRVYVYKLVIQENIYNTLIILKCKDVMHNVHVLHLSASSDLKIHFC